MAENIKVICRVRPLNKSETESGSSVICNFNAENPGSISIGSKTYTFDHTLQPSVHQKEVYEMAAKPIVADVLNGYNGTIFAYGQTSSGKTFTMEGVLGNSDFQGIIPRIIDDIFSHIVSMTENLQFFIKVSYFEIYMDKIRDLLDMTKTNLSVHESKDKVPYVKDISERFVCNSEEVMDVISLGKRNRHVAVTNMNEHSSRSHSVFLINVNQENSENGKKLHGKLYLVDLAGSEKVSKTGAEGTVLDEAKNINKSLSALGNVINALVESNPHIPYRDSKLTRILQESLGGNAKTTMVICCSPASFNEAETKSTLLFGTRAKSIKNMVSVNEELTAEEWRRRFEKEREKNRKLALLLQAYEEELKKWRGGTAVPKTDWATIDDATVAASVTASPSLSNIAAAAASNSAGGGGALGGGGGDGATSGGKLEAGKSLNELYALMDEKDDEINKQSQEIERLKQDLEAQEMIYKTEGEDVEYLRTQNAELQTQLDQSRDESKEVLTALEELAESFEKKEKETVDLKQENGELAAKCAKAETNLQLKHNEAQHSADLLSAQRNKYKEIISAQFRDVMDLGEILSVAAASDTAAAAGEAAGSGSGGGGGSGAADELDEECTVMRLFLHKLKTEARNVTGRNKTLETERNEQASAVRQSEEAGKELGFQVQELRARLATLTGKSDELEAERRRLQDRIDALNTENGRLKANEQMMGSAAAASASASAANKQEILAGQIDIKSKLEEELKRQGEQFAGQLRSLRNDVDAKQSQLEAERDQKAHLEFQNAKLREDLAASQKSGEATAAKLEEHEKAEERRRQAKEDLRGLEENVIKELQNLSSIRKMFIENLEKRIKRSEAMNAAANSGAGDATAAGGEGGVTAGAGGAAKGGGGEANGGGSGTDIENFDEFYFGGVSAGGGGGSSLVLRQRVKFLETNLDQLTSLHKGLVRDNADLRLQVPKLEKRLALSSDRVKMLENALRESKEAAMRDRKKYVNEVERIKEAVRMRTSSRKAANLAGQAQPQIVRPVRGGAAQQTSSSGGATGAALVGGGSQQPVGISGGAPRK